MACCCIKGNYDFHLEIVGKNKLKYTDLSDWMEAAPYVIVDHQTIEIAPYNPKLVTGNSKLVTVKPKGTTVHQLKDLGITCQDGFYTFSTFGCYNCKNDTSGERKYTRTKAITPTSQCQLDYLLSTEPNTEYENLKDIQCLLDAVHANSELQKFKQAKELLGIVKKKLAKYDCKICGC